MRATTLDSGAKEALRKTVRSLRTRLIDQLTEAAKGEYRLDVGIEKARLPEARKCRRERLEAWLDEQVRANGKSKGKGAVDLRQRHFQRAVKEAAHTLLNRIVLLRILEHHGIMSPAVVTGGWSSPAYEKEFVHYAGPLTDDDTRGYQVLLDTMFAELAVELPGLFGPVGLTPLFPVPATTLREVVEALNDPALASAWGDDTTLGWVYQYWNDPERESLDAKIAGGGKIEPHEIASKTQMFTERYMVEWLLQNSLGLTWLCICKKNGWTADAESVLPGLEERRAGWRKKRETGEVALDALMPVEAGLESAWKYYVPQPIPADAVAKAPSTIRDLKLLDPACGSGHFLVIAFDLLVGMYREEARHRKVQVTDQDIAEVILANNLHGVDIDPRAIQIAAAALYLKARTLSPTAHLSRVNLVAPALRLASLPDDDPSLVQLRSELKREASIPEELTRRLVSALAGVDHLGTLLKVDSAVEDALRTADLEIKHDLAGQGDLFGGFPMQQVKLSLPQVKATVQDKLEQFLARHSGSEDLGLRLEGEQLAAGLRFVRMVKEGTFDVVVGNPPYQGLSKTALFDYVVKNYPRGKADLYAAFLDRSLELAREGGLSALVTMRGWMFINQFAELRHHVLTTQHLNGVADLGTGAFSSRSMDDVISTALVVVRQGRSDEAAFGLEAAPVADLRRDAGKPVRRMAALWSQENFHPFNPDDFKAIEGAPVVYWWSPESLRRYAETPKFGTEAPAREGLKTGDDVRFLRRPWELLPISPAMVASEAEPWVPFIKGAEGKSWVEPMDYMLQWGQEQLALRAHSGSQLSASDAYFLKGVAFTTTGFSFSARVHRFPSVFAGKGRSVFPKSVENAVCSMNATVSRQMIESLNPTLDFSVGDVNRLPLFRVSGAELIFARIEVAFASHESHRECSVEYKSPGPSSWRYAQDWAQLAVDRPEEAPLPPYEPEYEPPPFESEVSFAIGVALGRFGANGEGILQDATKDALPAGILFISPTDYLPDSLQQPASAPILSAWSGNQPLRDWLRKDFFAFHKSLYENRPIYFPLSSEKRSFVAWVSIHRWADNTLQTLLADHLHPTLRQLDGEIADVNRVRATSDKKAAAAAEKQYATVKKLRDELVSFIDAVSQCAERGAPPTDPGCPSRAADATFHMDLDDGVMINSAGLWPLLAPQWNDPKKWWKQLCQAEGKKDYDWSHLARRYFPSRVDDKCKTDPSLAVAHGCFWKYHPVKAYAWELRLQDEIRPEFTIDEADSNECRNRFLADHPGDAAAIHEKEMVRRERKKAKQDDAQQDLELAAADDLEEDGDG